MIALKSWKRIPEHYRYVIVGGGGVLLGWVIYNLIFWLNPLEQNRATTSWFVAYFLAIIRQHALHYHLTFSSSEKTYFESLTGAFGAYGIGWIITTVANGIIMTRFTSNHNIAFFATLCIGVLLNYSLLRKLAFTRHPN